MTVIDVHTHMLNKPWLELLRNAQGARYKLQKSLDAPEGIFLDGAPFMTPMPGHFDYDLRIDKMDQAGVDIAVVSLTCPNVYWGGLDTSLEAAKLSNDSMAAAQTTYPDRIRWLASLPWEYPDAALAELKRACDGGAVGVMVLANVNGRSLTEDAFVPIWREIDKRGLPVLVHPTAPPGTPDLDMRVFNLIASVGFMMDTTLAIARMMFDGFFDRFPNLKIIASHAGGTLPYLVGRLDQCFHSMNACRTNTQTQPSDYLRHIYYDAVTYRQESLELCVQVGGADRVLYGSDYPHNIGDMAGCLSRVNNLPADQAKAVREDNALRIFAI
jgi:aminocarboxymuconate-semialdehyde decarboxylase